MCPRCNEALAVASSAGVEVDLCRQCGGVYLDVTEFDAILSARLGRKLESTFAFTGEQTALPLDCSGCGAEMHRAFHDEMEIDQCPSCGGIWLDHDERDELARAAASGRSTDRQSEVRCMGCADVVPERVCIKRMGQLYCEACVIAGNHPGPEAALVGRDRLLAGAARAQAAAGAAHAVNKARAEIREKHTGTTVIPNQGVYDRRADRALYESIARFINWTVDKIRGD